ncbi:MAG: helix-turn-helix domain-containing protein [Candidatus Cloacimonetes bacterium]|nr:helix-turn-helix domain-containing protein [Candidatus Cloacimonadota bacterium]MDY0367549.1 helix-turn-helix transcriptional regulator [Candidatus Syntrophosphaera sp.]
MSSENFTLAGKQIKKALIDLDLSYLALARGVGVSVYYIREIVNGTRKARAARQRIAVFLAAQYKRQGQQVPRAIREEAEAA